MQQHTEQCRYQHDYQDDTDFLLHEVIERLDRITRAVETGVAIVGPILGKRLAKLGVARAVGKFEAEWKNSDERD